MSDGRGFETFNEAFDLTKKFNLNSKGEISKGDAKKMFSSLDVNGDNEVSKNELADWVVKHKVLGNSDADARLVVNRIFADIDRNGDGTLQFEEFHKFMNGIVREQQTLKYVSRHHLTALPKSLRKVNSKAFTLKNIEEALQQKIQQLTSRDSDRFRQILTLLKCQSQRSNEIPMGGEEPVMGITKRDFNTVLAMLGLFSTRKQSEELFRRYDINGDGTLTAHEFLTKARPEDYPGFEVDSSVDDLRMGRGKRMYLKESLLYKPVRPQTPSQRIYYLSKQELCTRIRSKLEQKARCGQAFSNSLARRTLNRLFEDKDEEVPKRGLVSQASLRHVLNRVGVPMGQQHFDALMEDHAVQMDGFPQLLFDYRGFVMACYPSDEEANATSLFRPFKEDDTRMSVPPRPATTGFSSRSNSRANLRTPSGLSRTNSKAGFNAASLKPGMKIGPYGYRPSTVGSPNNGYYVPQQNFNASSMLPSV